jgi:hypothetical protein
MLDFSYVQTLPVRVSVVSPKTDESGYYQKAPLDSDNFNAEFGIDSLNDAPALRDYFCGHAGLYQVDDDMFDDTGQGCIRFDDDSTIKITDIREKISCNGGTEYFVLVDQTCTDFVWAVVEPCKTPGEGRGMSIERTVQL